MKTKGKRFAGFAWVFFIISVGTLVSSGIYLGKIIQVEATTGDIVRCVAFCAIGVLISAWSFFAPQAE